MSHVKLLLDENLSPYVAILLCNEGFDVTHVRDRGLVAGPDAAVLECAFAEDRILVTANVLDFIKLARARDIHPDIILVEDGDLLRDEQRVVIRASIDAIETEQRAGRDMVNRVLHIGWNRVPMFDDMPRS